jgi:hypothetical protein
MVDCTIRARQRHHLAMPGLDRQHAIEEIEGRDWIRGQELASRA